MLAAALLPLLAATSAADAAAGPTLFFGPTANLDKVALSALVDGLVKSPAGLAQWKTLRARMAASPGGGALHLRQAAFGVLSAAQQARLARVSKSIGLPISIEAGGALCGAGSGALAAQHQLQNNLHDFLQAGGTLSHVMLESVFSRTTAACGLGPNPNQTHAQTAAELAGYAAALKKGLGADTIFFLYDAIPHYAVGSEWPANTFAAHYELELGAVLTQLKAAMGAKGVKLTGYWADSPMEDSACFPCMCGQDPENPCKPGPDGAGYEKIAAAVKLAKSLGLQAGKTFNSQAGGMASSEAFYNGTLADWQGAAKAVPSAASGGHSFDGVMVETWYPHPAQAIPETTPYTTAYTALEVFKQIPTAA